MQRWFVRGFIGILALGAVVILILVLLPKPPIPGKIKQQLTSTLLLPNTRKFPVNRDTTKYDPSIKVLTYKVAAFGKTIIMSEQPTPDQFTDVPQVYQKVLDGMQDYNDFDVNVGGVHLTLPPQLSGVQTAVLNTKGTLIFAKPSGKLSDDQWRQFFTSFQVVN